MPEEDRVNAAHHRAVPHPVPSPYPTGAVQDCGRPPALGSRIPVRWREKGELSAFQDQGSAAGHRTSTSPHVLHDRAMLPTNSSVASSHPTIRRGR
ncbi:hypothetical protein NSPZN2_150040 [Nitrospira defluvii]|uniref:Uncharacterized protein n=1 Tax=Nitrospira defluvii TaxID=330214 RepID=A0ABM8RAL3_9BACT|nr:hypothetical protein NSPZN2_150040 [Nitrospira defluvii]